MRLLYNKTKPYPQMSIEDFSTWISELGEYFSHEDHCFIMDQMINNDVATDEELKEYFLENGVDLEFIEELIPMREYFWDFRYSQHINI